jgi:ribosome recycling factor
VQTIVAQFEQDRTKLMTQLKTCSEAQRQLILKDMEQLRTQMREQISKIRDDARQQAEQMRNRFNNNRDAILSQGAGPGVGGRDR